MRPTAKPHSGRGGATAARSCDSPKRARSVTINPAVAKYRIAAFYECFATIRGHARSHRYSAALEHFTIHVGAGVPAKGPALKTTIPG
ncbi:hypothetical protein E8E78_03185 [Pseudomonas sp. BN505]|nr:hypothetical protein [Pseudomonas sp. BN605]MDH4855614.1 hypothetical protein [Pseudomonas sp. BN505]NTY94275.1 hypothetical protein [Pseudomonas putida]NTZ03440.1 hypothetical protein [Pseudomonas putida]NTZ24804.1 hypothetical protein [Pseudomonas putida]